MRTIQKTWQSSRVGRTVDPTRYTTRDTPGSLWIHDTRNPFAPPEFE
ncbi:MAG: hypothetical protein AAB691_02300 [Patescibacteria group bacterium]